MPEVLQTELDKRKHQWYNQFMSRVPNYILVESMQIIPSNGGSHHDARTLPKGSFVRPIDLSYVPKHVLEQNEHRVFDPNSHAYCYTRFGIVIIPKAYYREV